MHGRLLDVAKGQKGLLMLAELAQHAAAMGEMGNLYTKWYLIKMSIQRNARKWDAMGNEVHDNSKVFL
jgi:hypothetical protein